MTSLMIGQSGEIALPKSVREHYQLKPNTPIRLIETRSGILLIPITGEPMSAELKQEIGEWQSLSEGSWAMFPYEVEPK